MKSHHIFVSHSCHKNHKLPLLCSSVRHIRIPPSIDTTHRLIREPDLLLPSRPTSPVRAFRCRVEAIYFIKVVSATTTLAPTIATSASVVRARRWAY